MLNKAKPTSIEEYLRQVAHELRDLPSDARAEELREIKAHLGAMVEAHQTADVDETQALAQTLKQFGRPRKVGRDLRWAWWRKQPEAWWRPVLAIFAGLAFYWIVKEPFLMGFTRFYAIHQNIDSSSSQSIRESIKNVPTEDLQRMLATLTLNQLVITVLMMFVMGHIVGFISPKWKRTTIIAIAASIYLPKLVTADIDSALRLLMWVLSVVANYFIPTVAGAYLGARHSRKCSTRIANTK